VLRRAALAFFWFPARHDDLLAPAINPPAARFENTLQIPNIQAEF
jgi:hypothetical protein